MIKGQESAFCIKIIVRFESDTYLVMADFNMLLHNDPGDGLCERGRGQRAVVRPVVIDVGGKQTSWIKAGELHHAVLKTNRDRKKT